MLGKSNLLNEPIYYTHYKIKTDNVLLADTFYSGLSDAITLTINSKKEIQENNFHKLKETLFKGDEKQTVDFISYFIKPEWIKAILDSLSLSYPGLGLITTITHAILTFYKEPHSNKINYRIAIKQANISYSNKDINQSESIDLNLIISIDYYLNFFLLKNLYSESNLEIEKLILSKKKRSELVEILCHQRLKLEEKRNIEEKIRSVTENIDKSPIGHLLSPEIHDCIKSFQTIETSSSSLSDLSVYACISDILYSLILKEKKVNFSTITPIIDILSVIIKYNNSSGKNTLKGKFFNFLTPPIPFFKKMEFIRAFGTYVKTEAYSELVSFIFTQKKLFLQDHSISDSDIEKIKKASFQLSRQEKKIYLDLIKSLLHIFELTEKKHLERFLNTLSLNDFSCEVLHNFLIILYQHKLSSIGNRTCSDNKEILNHFIEIYKDNLGIDINIKLESFISLAHRPLSFGSQLKEKEETIRKTYKNSKKIIMGDLSIALSLREKLIITLQKLIFETKNIKNKSQTPLILLEEENDPIVRKKYAFNKKYRNNLPVIPEEKTPPTKIYIQSDNSITDSQRSETSFIHDKINSFNEKISYEELKGEFQQILTINCKENSADYNYSAENFVASLKNAILKRKFFSKISKFSEEFFEKFDLINERLIVNIKNYIFCHNVLVCITDTHNNFYYFERSRGTTNPYFYEEKKFKNPGSPKQNKLEKNNLEGLDTQKLNVLLKSILLIEFDLFLSAAIKQDLSSLNDLKNTVKNRVLNDAHPENFIENYDETMKSDGLKLDFIENTFQKLMLSILEKTEAENNFLNKNVFVFIKHFPNAFFYKAKQGIFSSKKTFDKLVADILLDGSRSGKFYEDQIKCFFIKLPWYKLLLKYGILCLPGQANKIASKAIGKYLISAIYKKELETINEIKTHLNQSLHSNQILTLEENQKLASELVKLIKKIISLEENIVLEKTSYNMVRRDIALELGEKMKSEGVQELLKLIDTVKLFTSNQQVYWEQFVLHKKQIQLDKSINELQKKKKTYFEEIIQEHRHLKESLKSMAIQLNTVNSGEHGTKNHFTDKNLFSFFKKNEATNIPLLFASTIEEKVPIYSKMARSSI